MKIGPEKEPERACASVIAWTSPLPFSCLFNQLQIIPETAEYRKVVEKFTNHRLEVVKKVEDVSIDYIAAFQATHERLRDSPPCRSARYPAHNLSALF
jgi:hypothetical protein